MGVRGRVAGWREQWQQWRSIYLFHAHCYKVAHTIVVLFPQLFVICLTRCIISCVKKGLSPQGPPQCHCQLAGKKSQMPNKHLAMNEAFEFDFCPTCCERCDLHVCCVSIFLLCVLSRLSLLIFLNSPHQMSVSRLQLVTRTSLRYLAGFGIISWNDTKDSCGRFFKTSFIWHQSICTSLTEESREVRALASKQRRAGLIPE